MKICAICGSSVDDSAETCPHDGLADWLFASLDRVVGTTADGTEVVVTTAPAVSEAVVSNNDEVAALLAHAAKDRANKAAAKAAAKIAKAAKAAASN